MFLIGSCALQHFSLIADTLIFSTMYIPYILLLGLQVLTKELMQSMEIKPQNLLAHKNVS